jgi:NADH-quinone oxidoreductase subunit N
MNGADLVTLSPLLLLAGTSVLVMLAIAIRRSHVLILAMTLVGLAASFICIWVALPLTPRQVTPLLIVDRYALFYIGLSIAATFAVALLSFDYLKSRDVQREELYVLLLTATLGSAVLVASSHFASFFLGLEILSVSLYALNAYLRTRARPLEAGIKYLILAASSAAFLLFGMALIYSQLGSMSFSVIGTLLRNGANFSRAFLLVGTVLVITGFGFKLALVPFHLWTPDIYEGAPAPVAAFVATVSKGAMFALLLRYFYQTGSYSLGAIPLVFTIIAIASMALGNLLALLQSNVKRLLAYSSIAHMGYLLVAFEAGGSRAAEAVTFYLCAYFITMLAAFGVVTVASEGGREADRLEDYRGLFWRHPALALIFTASLLSLAGIPLTVGFVGKFYVLASGASSALWLLVLVLVVTSVFGLYYYLRVGVTLFAEPEAAVPGSLPSVPSLRQAGGYVLVVLSILLIGLGLYPGPLLDLIQRAVASLA